MKSAAKAAGRKRGAVMISVPVREESSRAPSSSAHWRMSHAIAAFSSSPPALAGKETVRTPMPAVPAKAWTLSRVSSGMPGREGRNPVTSREGHVSFNSSANRRDAEFSSKFRQTAPYPLFRMKSSIPLRRACRSCCSGEGRGESVPVEFSGEMTAESRSKRRSRLRRFSLPDHTEDAPGSRNGPSPPARRAVNTGRPVSRAVRWASSSSCSSNPSCHALAGVRSSRHVAETCGGGISPHGAMEKTASSSVLQMPKTGTRSFPCGEGGITACRGKERPFLNRWNLMPSASVAPSSRGTSAISRAR